MNQMKKNPLDDFFAERLSDHEVTPSQRAMDRFHEKLAEREKKASPFMMMRPKAWYYYGAAASVALLMTVGYLQFKSDEAVIHSTPGMAQNQKSVPKTDNHTAAVAENAVGTESKEQQGSKDKTVNKAVQQSSKPVVAPQTAPLVAQQKSVDELIRNIEIDERPKDQLAQALDRSESIKATRNTPVSTDQNKLFKSEVGETIVLITTIPEEEVIHLPNQDSGINKSKVVAMGTDKGEEEKSVFSRVFGEIRNLKHGEKVNLAKLGLKSNDDELAREDGFIASETRQIRQGWQWIKGKINNN